MSSSTFSPRVVLISGANKGIGYEAAKLLAHQLPQATILLGTRSLDNGEKAVQRMKKESQAHSFDNVKPIELDVTSKQSLDRAAQQVKSEYGSVDVLLCNAGVSGGSGETAEQVFAVNIDGVHDMIEAFLPLIPATGLIDVVASEVGAWGTNEMPPELQQMLTTPQTVDWPLIQQLESDWLKANKGEAHEHQWRNTKYPLTGSYTTSKALLIAYLRSFALQHQQPKLVITCPGFCATDLNRHRGHRPASKGGESVCWPVLHFGEAESGQFYQDGVVHPFVVAAPEWAVQLYAKVAEMQAAQARAAAETKQS